MTIALLEYFTTNDRTVVLLAKQGLREPVVSFAQNDDGTFLSLGDLEPVLLRLAIDFNGLPRGWDLPPADTRIRAALSLPPAVPATKRIQPVRTATLANPRFSYELTYFTRLSAALIPPAIRQQLDDCDLLCIVGHGPLHMLPFAALRWSADTYLIERFGLCYTPSATTLRHCQSKNRRRTDGSQPRSLLIAAVAAADDPDPEFFEADGEHLAELFSERGPSASVTRLVGAGPERHDSAASKANIMRLLPDHDVIHIACHGLFGGAQGSGPPAGGLLVSNGTRAFSLNDVAETAPHQLTEFVIAPADVFAQRFDSHLVTLRACSSGRAIVDTGDELMGLVRAFLYSGTPSLIVSLWDVNKRSSQLLLDAFYRLWLSAEGAVPKWKALQQAQLTLMRQPGLEHPYHWAPFVLVGDWL